MSYLEFRPHPTLEKYVECFWSMSILHSPENSKPHRVLPDGCIDIIFDFSDPGNPTTYAVGTMSRPIIVSNTERLEMLGIRFHPGAIRVFVNLVASEFTDTETDLESFWGSEAKILWERLAHLNHNAARILLLESYFLTKISLAPNSLDPYVQYSVKLIRSKLGTFKVRALESGTGLSIRQLERKFERDIGLSPKSFARVTRFQNIVRLVHRSSRLDWNSIAFEAGYSDQSHLIRDFKSFSGLTPSQFTAPR